jgi:hypothetical protein
MLYLTQFAPEFSVFCLPLHPFRTGGRWLSLLLWFLFGPSDPLFARSKGKIAIEDGPERHLIKAGHAHGR